MIDEIWDGRMGGLEGREGDGMGWEAGMGWGGWKEGVGWDGWEEGGRRGSQREGVVGEGVIGEGEEEQWGGTGGAVEGKGHRQQGQWQ